jgi:hypothetical protein
MLGQRGKAWRVTIFWLLCLALTPGLTSAAPPHYWPSWITPVAEISQSPMEAQLLGDKPYSKDSQVLWSGKSPLAELLPGLMESQDDGSILKLPQNVELRISFLYNGDKSALAQDRPIQSHLLFKYSMDYAVLPNLRVGLSGFLYHPKIEEGSYFQKRFGELVMGFGPGVKYDLGRWSFTFQSQVDTGNRDRKEGFQNWLRVWYAF